MHARRALWVLLALAMVGACSDPASRVTLVPVPFNGGCGMPSASLANRSMTVIAYTPEGDRPSAVPIGGGAVSLANLPDDTEQLGVELSGGSSTAPLAIGKSAPLDFAALGSGATIAVALAPPWGFCRTGDMAAPRVAPLTIAAGSGVLVVGGGDGGSGQLATAEYYDPASGTFTPVPVPSVLVDPVNGLAGASLAALPDGRVVLTGTSSHASTIFDPSMVTSMTPFSTPQVFDHRAFHASVALDADHLLVMGGCDDVTNAMCSTPLHSSFIYTIDDLQMRVAGPSTPTSQHVNAHLFALGEQADGAMLYAIAGGISDGGAVDEFEAADTVTATRTSADAQVAALDGGALLTAFEPDGSAGSGSTVAFAAGSGSPVSLAPFPSLEDPRLVTLEDGSVLAIGGTADGSVWRYVPTSDAWLQVLPPVASDPPLALASPTLVRLADGSVLALGGTIGGSATAGAWVFRPSLVGPSSGLVEVDSGASDGAMLTSTAPQPGGPLSLGGGASGAAALVGGPRTSAGAIDALVQVTIPGSAPPGLGISLLAQWQGPGRVLVGTLVPNQPAQITHYDGSAMTGGCAGSNVPAFDSTIATPVELAISGHTVTLKVAQVPYATCNLASDRDAEDRGAWGLAVDAGVTASIVTVTVSR